MMLVNLKVREELLMAVKGAEESLFQLKRARLLREVDVMVQQSNQQSELQPAEAASRSSPLNSEADPEGALQLFQAGSKCRFWHTDGRWYNGRIIRLEGGSVARVSFLTPTSEKLQVKSYRLIYSDLLSVPCLSSVFPLK